jgi:hypothetical protein
VVDANFYTQLSMARTMQDILHVEPQTHFLKAARAMNSVFTADKDLSTYTALKPKIALDTMNPALSGLTGRRLDAARRSAAMNWNHMDDVPTAVLNQILWWDNRGYDKTLPPRGLPTWNKLQRASHAARKPEGRALELEALYQKTAEHWFIG